MQPLGAGKGHDTDNDAVPPSPIEMGETGLGSHSGGGGGEEGDSKHLMRERTYSAPNVTYVQTTRQRREVNWCHCSDLHVDTHYEIVFKQRMVKQAWSLDSRCL